MINTISTLMSDLIQRMSLETSYNSFIKTSDAIDSDVKDLFREYLTEGGNAVSERRKSEASIGRGLDRTWTDLCGSTPADANLDLIRSWAFSDYNRVAESPVECLSTFSKYFNYFGLLQKIKPASFESFVVGMKSRYNARNAYHNWTHAYATLHVTFLLLDNTAFRGLFDKEDMLGLLLAAIGHDVEHPGYTNTFQVATGSPLALRYNDMAVLESHHAAVTCSMIKGDEQNILDDVRPEVFKRVRKVVVDSILWTDMAKHQECVTWCESSSLGLGELRETGTTLDKDVALKLCGVILHSADLAHPALPWLVHLEMSKRVANEFRNQFQEEEKLGLPTLPFMGKDPDLLQGFAPVQVGFVQFVAVPQWKGINNCAGEGHLQFAVDNVENNKSLWQAIGESGKLPEETEFKLPEETIPMSSRSSSKSIGDQNGVK